MKAITLTIILIALLFILIVVGISIKSYTKKQVESLDGLDGTYQKKDCNGTVFSVGKETNETESE